jgi:hypothetical protein
VKFRVAAAACAALDFFLEGFVLRCSRLVVVVVFVGSRRVQRLDFEFVVFRRERLVWGCRPLPLQFLPPVSVKSPFQVTGFTPPSSANGSL